jgi:hypothetical protein
VADGNFCAAADPLSLLKQQLVPELERDLCQSRSTQASRSLRARVNAIMNRR